MMSKRFEELLLCEKSSHNPILSDQLTFRAIRYQIWEKTWLDIIVWKFSQHALKVLQVSILSVLLSHGPLNFAAVSNPQSTGRQIARITAMLKLLLSTTIDILLEKVFTVEPRFSQSSSRQIATTPDLLELINAVQAFLRSGWMETICWGNEEGGLRERCQQLILNPHQTKQTSTLRLVGTSKPRLAPRINTREIETQELARKKLFLFKSQELGDVGVGVWVCEGNMGKL